MYFYNDIQSKAIDFSVSIGIIMVTSVGNCEISKVLFT